MEMVIKENGMTHIGFPPGYVPPNHYVTNCACLGPQNGQPLCPCQMRGLIKRDGYWVRPEQVIGPVRPTGFGAHSCSCGKIVSALDKYCSECGEKVQPA